MLAAQAARPAARRDRLAIRPDDPEQIAAAVAGGGRAIRPRDRDRRLERRAATTTPPTWSRRRARCSSTASPSSPAIPSCSAPSTATAGARRARLSGLRRAHLRHLRAPAARRGSRARPPVERPRAQARLARRLASSLGADDWVRVRLGRVGGGLVATPLPARRRRAHLARARRRPARRARARSRATTPATTSTVRLLRDLGDDRAHDRRDRLARPRARPRRVRAARPRPAA